MNESSSIRVVTLEGNLGIGRSQEIKDSISTAFSESMQVLLSLSMVDELDISILQILYAAKKEALSLGKQFHLSGSLKPEIIKKLLRYGFINHPIDSAKELEKNLIAFESEGVL